MSRIVNLKTVRFKIFNVLDSWHANWADEFNYGSLLYEDLGIRSYFIGIFYRLRMPTNYIYIHRMAGDQLVLNTDIYFYKPFKRTKLRRYFVEQRHYINYILKLYVYFVPFFFRFVNKDIQYNRRALKRVSFFDIIRLQQYNTMGFFGLRKSFKYLGCSLSEVGDSKLSYIFSSWYNKNFLFSFNSLTRVNNIVRLRMRTRRTSVLRTIGSTFSRLYYTLVFNGANTSFVSFLAHIVGPLSIRSLVCTRVFKQRATFPVNVRSIISPRTVMPFKSSKYRYHPVDSLFSISSISFLRFHRVFIKFVVLYLRLKKMNPLHIKFRKFFKKKKRKLNKLFFCWCNTYVKRFLLHFLSKIVAILFVVNSRIAASLYSRLLQLSTLFIVQQKVIHFTLKSNTPSFFNKLSYKSIYIKFLSYIRKIHVYYYKGRRPTLNRLTTPKKFQYTHINTKFIELFFSYFFNHIESVISAYTKQQVYCLYNLFYLGISYYPPILNAKVICDYYIYMIHNRKSIRGAFYKVRQWQLANIQRRVSLESMYFKTQIKRRAKTYLDHLSYKKYPIMGIRIECSGNKKKGTMARKFFYGDVIKNINIVQKSPNNTFAADMDYYQSFALTKSCSIGVKVWVFFKTYLYDTHGAIKTLIVY